MVRRTLIVTAILVVVGLIILWFMNGGVGKIAATAARLNPFAALFSVGTSSQNFQLPWQPDISAITPTIPEQSEPTKRTGDSTSPEGTIYDIPSDESKTFGNPSPHREKVTLRGSGGAELGEGEYVELDAGFGLTAPINITGWSLQSAVTGVRAYIPLGSTQFLMGALNAQADIYLDPGVTAIVASGFSPVGTSFRENKCSGYLAQFQKFSPHLWQQCPAPYEMIELTADNIRTFGDACFDFLRSIPSCETPRSAPPSVSPACLSFAMNTFSYNGCTQRYQNDPGFALNSWRIYLNASGELWRNSHDVIRLLDAQGRTVDSITY